MDLNFNNYDNPGRAREVWEAYLPDVIESRMLKAAVDVVGKNDSAISLDLKLDELLSEGLLGDLYISSKGERVSL